MRPAASYPHTRLPAARTPLAVQTKHIVGAVYDLIAIAFIPLGVLAAGHIWWGV